MDGAGNRRVLVGREHVLHTLRLAVDDALTGRGGLTLLAGEPGVGKTRLVEETCDYARSRRAVVAWGSCWEGEGVPGFWPWSQVLRSLTDADRNPIVDDVAAAALEMNQLVAEATTVVRHSPGPLTTAGQERFRLFDEVARLLRACCRSRPLVVVLDDLHWSDASSLRLLRFLAQDLRTSPILILGAYRDMEIDAGHPMAELLGEQTWCQHLRVGGLAQQDVGRLVAEISGLKLGDSAAEMLRAATGGNPFFVRELAGLLADREGLFDGPMVDGLPASLAVPGGVTAVLNRRIDRLSRPCQEVLEVAAVLGLDFDLDVLSAVLERSEEASSTLAAEAERARVLVREPWAPARFRFVHALLRQTLYSRVAPGRRVDLHARAAQAVERRHGDNLTPRVAQVAHHLWEAGTNPAKALEYTVEAAGQAMDALAYEEAVTLFARAANILEGSSPASAVRRCELLLQLADAQLATGSSAAARRTFKEVALVAKRAGAHECLARAALAVGNVYAFGVLDNLEVGLLQTALKALPGDEVKLRARLLARLAKALVLTAGPERRTELSEEAVELARRSGDREVLGWVLLDRHIAIWGFAPAPERLEIATGIVDLAEELGDRDLLACGRVLRLANLLELGDIAGYAAEIHVFEQLVRENRMTELQWHVPLLRVTEAHIAGRLTEAEQWAEYGLALGRRVNHPGIDRWYMTARSLLKLWQGRTEDVEVLARRLIERAPTVSVLRTALALILAETGRREEAAIELERQGADRFSRVHRDFTWLVNISCLAAVCHSVGSRSHAAVLYDLLLPHAPYLVRPNQVGIGCGGPVSYFLGLLAMTLDQPSDAVRHLDEAIAMSERIGAPLFAAQARAKLADCLDARGRREDRRRAADLRRQADAAMRTLGARPILQPAVPLRPPEPRTAVLRREGDYWSVQHSAGPVRIRDRLGLHYLCRLLSEPEREFHVLDLAAPTNGEHGVSSAGTGPALDEKAKAEYRRRRAELQEDLREAESFDDRGRTESIRRELEMITDQLRAAVGLGGQDRQSHSDAERARTAVTKAIKSAIAHIAEYDRILGGHLHQAVRTGTYCAYTPDPTAPLNWTL
jgi:tetratricopeptide (TPR) repeat protein